MRDQSHRSLSNTDQLLTIVAWGDTKNNFTIGLTDKNILDDGELCKDKRQIVITDPLQLKILHDQEVLSSQAPQK
jgi:hypothetical protein